MAGDKEGGIYRVFVFLAFHYQPWADQHTCIKSNSVPQAAAVAQTTLQVAAAAGSGREGIWADVVAVEEGGMVKRWAGADQHRHAVPGQAVAARQVQVAQLWQTSPLWQHPEITR